MLADQEILEYRHIIEKISNVNLSYTDAKEQLEKIVQMYLVVYSKNLCDEQITKK